MRGEVQEEESGQAVGTAGFGLPWTAWIGSRSSPPWRALVLERALQRAHWWQSAGSERFLALALLDKIDSHPRADAPYHLPRARSIDLPCWPA
jgi:hypothetical protein